MAKSMARERVILVGISTATAFVAGARVAEEGAQWVGLRRL